MRRWNIWRQFKDGRENGCFVCFGAWEPDTKEYAFEAAKELSELYPDRIYQVREYP
jgi:hypothetical protein